VSDKDNDASVSVRRRSEERRIGLGERITRQAA
jgi:hypothetical protein